MLIVFFEQMVLFNRFYNIKKGAIMGTIKYVSQIFCIIFIVLATLTTCDIGDDEIEVLGDGLVSVKGHDILLIENSDSASDLWIVAGDKVRRGVWSVG